jgi:replicative DNA helicase
MTPLTYQTAEAHIARTLLQGLSERKWNIYRSHFQDFFKERWPQFDQLISFISDFFARFGKFPTVAVFELELNATNEMELLAYTVAIANDAGVPVYNDADFAGILDAARIICFRYDLLRAMTTFHSLANGPAATRQKLLADLDNMRRSLYTSQQRALGSDAEAEIVLQGERGQKRLQEFYDQIKEKHRNGKSSYDLPYSKFQEVRLKPGDLVFVGAYTSHGKSLLLRALAYHLLITHGLNVFFCSLEMNLEVTCREFSLYHANHKQLYPNTPEILVDTYKKGELTDEQEDFLFRFANERLTQNSCYGVLAINHPNKSGYSLPDLAEKLAMVEQTMMPVHVLVIDYITYMNPVPTSRMAPVRIDDYNDMIKDLKRLCLAHRNREGKPAPMICLTAAQISRKGLDEAMKREGLYDLQAFSTYTEIERSADIAMTALMTPEMRSGRQLKLQVLKNRDGVVPTEPLTLNVDFAHGSRLRELNERDPVETANALRTLAF